MDFDKTIKKIETETSTADNKTTVRGEVEDLGNRVSTTAADDIDDAILRANGHDAVLKRQFRWISALGLAFSITNSWIGYLSNFGQNLVYGGPAVVIFGLVIAFVVQGVITLGLSELASAFPSSGGQYHFCFILAPEKHKRFAAFVVGWMSVLAWWIITASGTSLAAITVVGLAKFFHPEYTSESYQIWLVYCAVAFVTMLPLFIAPSKIAITMQITLLGSIVGFALCFITNLAMSDHKQPASWLTRGGLGTSGWSDGTAWLLGISNAMYAYGGTDGVIHISEEIRQPGKRVPQVMIVTMLIGLLTTLPLFLVLLFCMTSLKDVLESPLPSLEIILQSTGSRAATAFLIIWIACIYILCLSAQWVTSGRIAWAFARDGGLPYSEYFSHVDTQLNFPVRTTIVAFAFVCIYGLLYLASTTAFNSIVTTAVLFLNITYVTPQGILLFSSGRSFLPMRYLRLGWLGYFCNWFSVLWIVILGTTVCMPPNLPVTTANMNYTSPILVGLFSLIMLAWFLGGQKKFKGPRVDLEFLDTVNQQPEARNSMSHGMRDSMSHSVRNNA